MNRSQKLIFLFPLIPLVGFLIVWPCLTPPKPKPAIAQPPVLPAEKASERKSVQMSTTWYGGKFYERRWTASGIRKSSDVPPDLWRFSEMKFTCAHRDLPFGTILLVQYKGEKVEVMVTDRGPLEWTGHDLDVSRIAAEKLGMVKAGVAITTVTEIGKWTPSKPF